MDEIEDSMLPGIKPGDECGPGDWTLRGCCGGQTVKAALISQTLQIRKVVPVPRDEGWVHSIHAQNDNVGKGSAPVKEVAAAWKNR